MMCSQLSSTIRICLSRSQAASPGKGLTPENVIPGSAHSAPGTRSGSDKGASPTNHAPSLYEPHTAPTTATATVVLPIPPGPTMVRKRRRASRAASATMASSRPTIRVNGAGELPTSGHPRGRRGRRQHVLPRHRCDKSITSAREVGDVALAGAAIPRAPYAPLRRGPTRRRHRRRCRGQVWAISCSWRSSRRRARSAQNQDIERAAAEAQRFPVLEQRALSGYKLERSEAEDFFIHRAIAPRGFRNWYRLWRTFASPPVATRRRSAMRGGTCKQMQKRFCTTLQSLTRQTPRTTPSYRSHTKTEGTA